MSSVKHIITCKKKPVSMSRNIKKKKSEKKKKRSIILLLHNHTLFILSLCRLYTHLCKCVIFHSWCRSRCRNSRKWRSRLWWGLRLWCHRIRYNSPSTASAHSSGSRGRRLVTGIAEWVPLLLMMRDSLTWWFLLQVYPFFTSILSCSPDSYFSRQKIKTTTIQSCA